MIPAINRFRKVAKLIMVRFCKGSFISKRVATACGVSNVVVKKAEIFNVDTS